MAAPQYPYGWSPQPELATKKGVNNILNAMYATVLIMVVAIPMVIILWLGMGSLEGDFDSSMISVIAGLAIFGLIIVICGLYALINYLIGLVRMNRGKKEFGPAHEQKVSRAIMLIVLMIILTVASSMVVAALTYASITSITSPGTVDAADTWLVAQGVGSAIGIVTAICQNLAMVYLIYELSDEKHRTYLWAGFGVNIASAVVSAIVVVSLYYILSNQELVDLSNSYALSFMSLPFSVVGFFLYLICYKDALRRITSGEIRPVAPPMASYPYPYPPQPYYAPPPPQEMRICQGCGKYVQVSYNVCPYCGRPASLPPPPPPPDD